MSAVPTIEQAMRAAFCVARINGTYDAAIEQAGSPKEREVLRAEHLRTLTLLGDELGGDLVQQALRVQGAMFQEEADALDEFKATRARADLRSITGGRASAQPGVE